MNTLTALFLIFSTIFFLFLSIIWTKESLVNVTIKTLCIVMTVLGAYLISHLSLL